jgi:hypothetical protein
MGTLGSYSASSQTLSLIFIPQYSISSGLGQSISLSNSSGCPSSLTWALTFLRDSFMTFSTLPGYHYLVVLS